MGVYVSSIECALYTYLHHSLSKSKCVDIFYTSKVPIGSPIGLLGTMVKTCAQPYYNYSVKSGSLKLCYFNYMSSISYPVKQ